MDRMAGQLGCGRVRVGSSTRVIDNGPLERVSPEQTPCKARSTELMTTGEARGAIVAVRGEGGRVVLGPINPAIAREILTRS